MAVATDDRRSELLELAEVISADACALAEHEQAAALVFEVRALRLTMLAALTPAEQPHATRAEIEEGWYEVELMGHRRRSGYLRCVSFGGRQLIEITQPAHPMQPPRDTGDDDPELRPALVEFYSPTAIFSLSPSTERDVIAELVERSYEPF